MSNVSVMEIASLKKKKKRNHKCQVSYQPFAGTGSGTGCFLAGLFTFERKQPTVNWLTASGRNWLSISGLWKKEREKEKGFMHCLSRHYAELGNVVGPACK